jgi:hypothetical protein
MDEKPKPRSQGRISLTVPISLPPQVVEYINRRVSELRPLVANRSHYFQLLVDAEKSGAIETFPKEDPQLLMAGIAA